jgi:hypothetical protein
MTAAPLQFGFEYEVKLAVSIPLAWAELLKEAAKHHYDYKCRESGERGVVNALYNTAQGGPFMRMRQEDRAADETDEDLLVGINHPVSFSDLDLVSKVAEQLRYHSKDGLLVLAIHAWLQDTMEALSKQRALCMKLPGSAEPA